MYPAHTRPSQRWRCSSSVLPSAQADPRKQSCHSLLPQGMLTRSKAAPKPSSNHGPSPLRHSQTRGQLWQHEASWFLERLLHNGCCASAQGERRRSLPLSAASSPGSSATPRTFCSCTACSQRVKWPQSKCRDASVPGGQLEEVSVNASFTRSQISFQKPGGRTSRSGNGSREQSSSSGLENKGAFMQRTMAGSEWGQDSCKSHPRKKRPSLAVRGEIPA